MILDGKAIAKKIKNKLKDEVIKNNGQINLTVIQVGNDKASSIYIKAKEKLVFKSFHMQNND